MLRDGQFLAEPPVKIGAHYVPARRHEMTETELFTQSVLLGQKPTKARKAWVDVIALVVGVYALMSVLAGFTR